jgi:hypothetical protein
VKIKNIFVKSILFFELILKPILFVYASGIIQLFLNYVILTICLFTYIFINIILRNKTLKLNKYFLLLFFIDIFYLFYGLSKGALLKDALAGSFFFIAPFVGYFTGSMFFINESLRQKSVLIFFKLSLLVLLFGISGKIYALLNGRPFVVYAGLGIDMLPSAMLYVGYLWITFKKKNIHYSNFFKFLIFLFLFIQILVPVVRPFKASLIMMVVWLLPLLWYSYGTKKTLISIFIFIPFIYYYSSELTVVQRLLESFTELSESTSRYDDKRYAEIIGVFDTMKKNYFIDIIFGNGSGARWYATNPNFSNIIRILDMRYDGGVHHVHVTWLALLNRHGLFGIFTYLIFLIIIFYKLFDFRKINHNLKFCQTSLQISMIIFLISLLSGSLVDWQIYSDTYIGFLIAMVLPINKNSYENSNTRPLSTTV